MLFLMFLAGTLSRAGSGLGISRSDSSQLSHRVGDGRNGRAKPTQERTIAILVA